MLAKAEPTKEEQIEYNRGYVRMILEYRDSLPLCYCANIPCGECPCNISRERTNIVCISHIQEIR